MTKSKGTKDMELNPHSDWYGGGKKKPHTCPVCGGTGRVSAGKILNPELTTTCHACDGSGVLWERQ